jgi:hypothetical protein
MWEGGRYYHYTAYSPDKIDLEKYRPKVHARKK